jgi:protocatechuate 3,4-dioxygenase beta subunit
MDDDDRQIGTILSRREVFALLGAAGAVGAAGVLFARGRSVSTVAAQVPACVVRPEVTEGPYYVDEDLLRSDIRADPATGVIKEGTPLVLTFDVSQLSAETCTPLQGAEVEVWHCDAAGVYSDVSDRGSSTVGQQFLRGSQITDAAGTATFATIYPGWYPGRAVHIHFKVRPDADTVFTSQVFFDDGLSDRVFAQAPYAAKGRRNTLNRTDGIYQASLLLTATETAEGVAATFPIALDVSTLGARRASGVRSPGQRPAR